MDAATLPGVCGQADVQLATEPDQHVTVAKDIILTGNKKFCFYLLVHSSSYIISKHIVLYSDIACGTYGISFYLVFDIG